MASESLPHDTHFNSQPHKEADYRLNIVFPKGTISIHSLTRRLTRTVQFIKDVRDISIHSLTRRLTTQAIRLFLLRTHFNSQPHKEADYPLASGIPFSSYFNSQPHKEADFRTGISIQKVHISIHSLTRRLTFELVGTASITEDFNSQPHKEADVL